MQGAGLGEIALAESQVAAICLEPHADRFEHFQKCDLLRIVGEQEASTVASLTLEDTRLRELAQQLGEVRTRDTGLPRDVGCAQRYTTG